MNQARTDRSIWAELTQSKPAVMAVDTAVDPAHPDPAAGQVPARLARLTQQLASSQQGRLLQQGPLHATVLFERADHAVSAALQLQRDDPGFRIGAHLDDGSPAGRSRQLAHQLARMAEPGEVLLSQPLRDQIVVGLDAEIEEVAIAGAQAAFRIAPCGGADPAWADPATTAPTLLMLPLRVAAGNRCDPVYAELLNYGAVRALSQNKAWRVISRLSAQAYRHRHPQPGELKSRLRASHVLSGTVAVEGKQLHLEIDLVDTRSGRLLWKDRISHPLSVARAPENAFGRAVVQGASQAIFGSVGTDRSPAGFSGLDSWKLLFSAIVLMHRSADSDFEHAHTLLTHLLERQPRASEPQAWLAKWHVMRVARGSSTDIDADARLAQEAASRALQNDGDRSSALAVDGVVQAFLLQDLQRAEAQLSAAVADNPNESLAWLFMSAVYAYQDRGAAAADAAGLALQLSPLDPMRYYFDSFASHAMLAAGRLNDAIVLGSRSLSANGKHLPTWRTLAIARMLNSQESQAQAAVAALRRLDPHYTVKRFEERYPGRGTPFARRCAEALRAAGLPQA